MQIPNGRDIGPESCKNRCTSFQQKHPVHSYHPGPQHGAIPTFHTVTVIRFYQLVGKSGIFFFIGLGVQFSQFLIHKFKTALHIIYFVCIRKDEPKEVGEDFLQNDFPKYVAFSLFHKYSYFLQWSYGISLCSISYGQNIMTKNRIVSPESGQSDLSLNLCRLG